MDNALCIMCQRDIDDIHQLGEKITVENVTAHHFCLLLSAGPLPQNGEDDEGFYGFMPDDIKVEVERAKREECVYCKKSGANIRCVYGSCVRSFHLPCAIVNNCRFKFVDLYQSYCHAHHGIRKPQEVHSPSDECSICMCEMGEYNRIQSIPLPCCNPDAYCHKLCLQKLARTFGNSTKCPLCNDEEDFQEWIVQRGVFIPDHDADWENDEDEPSDECVAEVCKCEQGRKHQIETEGDKYSLVYCEHCGGPPSVHLGCIIGAKLLCEDCTAIENKTITPSAEGDQWEHRQHSADDHGKLMTQPLSIASADSVLRSSVITKSCRNKRSHKHMISDEKECNHIVEPLASKGCDSEDGSEPTLKKQKKITDDGALILDRDAKLDIDEGEPNTFHEIEQHSEQLSDAENDKHSLVYCQDCGSNAAHLGCIKDGKVLCEECTAIAKNIASSSSTANAQQAQNSINAHGTQTQSIASGNNSNATHTDDRLEHLLIKNNVKECSIFLKRLTAKDLSDNDDNGPKDINDNINRQMNNDCILECADDNELNEDCSMFFPTDEFVPQNFKIVIPFSSLFLD